MENRKSSKIPKHPQESSVKKRQKWRSPKNKIAVVATLFTAVCGIILPGQILAWQKDAGLKQVKEVPQQYFAASSSAMAHAASERLTAEERLGLISGKWESEVSEAETYEMSLSAYEALEQTRAATAELYQQKWFPVDLTREYGNWYTWDAVPYQAVDSVFHTYAAYYWKICFYWYDGSREYTVYVLEDGTVFYAEAYYKESRTLKEILEEMYAAEPELISKEDKPDKIIPYKGEAISKITHILVNSGEEGYQMIQANGANEYVYAVTAAETE